MNREQMNKCEILEVIGHKDEPGIDLLSIAYKRGFINREQLISLAEPVKKSQYGKYLLKIANEEVDGFATLR